MCQSVQSLPALHIVAGATDDQITQSLAPSRVDVKEVNQFRSASTLIQEVEKAYIEQSSAMTPAPTIDLELESETGDHARKVSQTLTNFCDTCTTLTKTGMSNDVQILHHLAHNRKRADHILTTCRAATEMLPQYDNTHVTAEADRFEQIKYWGSDHTPVSTTLCLL